MSDRTPTLILFDVDGTLIETNGAGRRALVAALRERVDGDGVEEATRRVRFQGKTDPIIVTEMAETVGLDPETFGERLEAFWPRYLEHLRAIMARPDERRRTLPGIVPLLEHLHARPGVELGLLTGNIEQGARTKLAAFDLNRFFPDGGFASDHADRSEIARLAHERLSRRHGTRFSPRSTVVVGDTMHDVECGRANGFRTVAVDSGWVTREELERSEPDVLLDDFTDLDRTLAAFGLTRG